MHRFLTIIVIVLGLAGVTAPSRNTTAQTVAKTAANTASPQTNTQRPGLQLPLSNPRIVVRKAGRELELYAGNELLRTYKIGLGLNPIPDKQREGDRATPEGDFYVFTKNPKSQFHLSLGISYPNIEDAERGLRDGLITPAERNAIVRAINRKKGPPQYTALGGLIYIHGSGQQRLDMGLRRVGEC